VEAITTGLQWKRARPAHSVVGQPTKDDLEELWDLGASLAALLTLPA
jgi:hypothetical protein